jgi:hypothetical protein
LATVAFGGDGLGDGEKINTKFFYTCSESICPNGQILEKK